MEIEQLQNFLKVAEKQNFTRAAEELGLSQPALSRAIARLEEELGQPVFERQTRGLQLTESGRLLQGRAQQIIALVEDTKSEICDDGQSGRLRIAAIPTIAPYFLPKILRGFAEKFPRAMVTVQEDTTDQILKRCKQGEVDLAIVALPVTEKYLEIEELLEEELFLVLPELHPLAQQEQITFVDVEACPFVLLAEAHCLSDNILSFCRQRSFLPVTVERTSQLATIQELVSLNHGVSMVPAMARQIDHCPSRVYRSLTDQTPTRKIAMVWNPYRFQSRLFKAFLDHLRQSVLISI